MVKQSQYAKMTLQEKLDFVDDELKKLHLFCTKSGYTASQIESFAQPFFQKDANHLGSAIWASGKAWKRRAVALIVGVVLAILLFMNDPGRRAVCALTRHGAKQILPLWDWTEVSKESCFVKNPLYEPMNLTMLDCELCEGTELLERLRNVDGHRLVECKYRQVPFIVEDASVNWGNDSNITIMQLAEMYNTHPVLQQKNSCELRTNVRDIYWDHIILLNKVIKGKFDRFYAHWQNCNAVAAKVLRQIYSRPYFMPSAYTLAASNWVFISSNYSGVIFKPVNINEDILLLIQLKGENHVNIKTLEPCTDVCSKFEDTLHQGEILVVPTYLWRLDYLPSSSPENIAIALAVSFN